MCYLKFLTEYNCVFGYLIPFSIFRKSNSFLFQTNKSINRKFLLPNTSIKSPIHSDNMELLTFSGDAPETSNVSNLKIRNKISTTKLYTIVWGTEKKSGNVYMWIRNKRVENTLRKDSLFLWLFSFLLSVFLSFSTFYEVSFYFTVNVKRFLSSNSINSWSI